MEEVDDDFDSYNDIAYSKSNKGHGIVKINEIVMQL